MSVYWFDKCPMVVQDVSRKKAVKVYWESYSGRISYIKYNYSKLRSVLSE